MCFLTDNIYDYYNVSQGKITIPSMDDGEEFSLTDVSLCFTCNVNVDFLVTLPPPCIVFNLYILRNPKKNKPTNEKTKYGIESPHHQNDLITDQINQSTTSFVNVPTI